jgi:hypothetical protein
MMVMYFIALKKMVPKNMRIVQLLILCAFFSDLYWIFTHGSQWVSGNAYDIELSFLKDLVLLFSYIMLIFKVLSLISNINFN